MPSNIVIGDLTPQTVSNPTISPLVWTKADYRDGSRPLVEPPVQSDGNGPLDLTDSRYDDFRADFLAIDQNTPYALIDMHDVHAQGESFRNSFLISGTTEGFKVQKFQPPNGSETNNGTTSLSWGVDSDGRNAVVWRSETNNGSYDPEAGDTWDGIRLWLGTAIKTNFLSDIFEGANAIPLNRLCIEIEFPEDAMTWSGDTTTDAIIADQSLGQCANPGSAGEFSSMFFEGGTYTATRTDESGNTVSAENSGTWNSGDSHFYHKFTRYGAHPLDRFYVVDNKTVVFVMGPNPDGTRGNGRPSFVCNPMTSVVGETNNVTDAYSYFSYLTRFYFDLWNVATVFYPFEIKIKRFWLQYEPDDIMILNSSNGLRGQQLTEQGNTAIYQATLYNKASENRTYRISLAVAGGLPLTSSSSVFKVYIDTDGVGVVNGNSVELVSGQTVELTANTDYPLLFVHTPDFTSPYHTGSGQHYSRESCPASFCLVEVNRLRSASYYIQTWEADNSGEVSGQAAILANLQYPSDYAGSPGEYYTRRAFNQERNDKSWFIRNYPDYVEFTS